MDNPNLDSNPDSDPLRDSSAWKSPSPPLITHQQPASSSSSSSTQQHQAWKEAQDSLKKCLITEDDFEWKLAIGESGFEALKYVGGVDISFSEDDEALACGTIVVLELHSLRVVYEDFSVVELRVPYIPGFLAFREAPVLLELLERMKNNASPFYPQVLMVDGNGLLHPRGFGLACHLGVMANLPTIGIGKNLHHVDGLTLSGVKRLLKARDLYNEDFTTLTGDSGQVWGAAMRSTEGSSKPIFVSIGHRISLDTAIAIVKMTCKYRVPEPIRQADIRSRDYLRKHRLKSSEFDNADSDFERCIILEDNYMKESNTNLSPGKHNS